MADLLEEVPKRTGDEYMATIRASCPDCGDVEFTTRDVQVRVSAPDGSGTYAFSCPGCAVTVVKAAETRDVVGEGLTKLGAIVDNCIAYQTVAETTGGQYYRATDEAALRSVYQEISRLERTEMEESMLNFAAGTQGNSRLACQIEMHDALDGLVVRLPEGQH